LITSLSFHADTTQNHCNEHETTDNDGSLYRATNGTDQAAITAGQRRGTSILRAFDEAWNKAIGKAS